MEWAKLEPKAQAQGILRNSKGPPPLKLMLYLRWNLLCFTLRYELLPHFDQGLGSGHHLLVFARFSENKIILVKGHP